MPTGCLSDERPNWLDSSPKLKHSYSSEQSPQLPPMKQAPPNNKTQFDEDHQNSPRKCSPPPLPPGMIEERVQVNRRKLEQMMQEPVEISADLWQKAEEFFADTSSETNTQISWPTRLKIGAKTKKDPHVKIVGYPQDVDQAVNRILQVLERKQNRVTLKIDISYNDHSHIIGKGGQNTRKVLMETRCHIHFPDSNRVADQPKSNQVTIAGIIADVEKARSSVRDLAPISVSIDLRDWNRDPNTLLNHPALNEISDRYEVAVLVRENRTTNLPFLIIKANAFQELALVHAIRELENRVLAMQDIKLCLALEILPPQQAGVVGTDGCNMQSIMNRTGAHILYPRSDDSGSTTFYIQGTVDSVLLARKHLIGLLPAVLVFDITGQFAAPSPAVISKMENDLRLSLSVRPKRSSDGRVYHTVTVKGDERSLSRMYEARRLLCSDGALVMCTDYEFMSDFDDCNAQGMTPLNGHIQNLQIETAALSHNSPILYGPSSASPLYPLSPYYSVYSPSCVPSPIPAYPNALSPLPVGYAAAGTIPATPAQYVISSTSTSGSVEGRISRTSSLARSASSSTPVASISPTVVQGPAIRKPIPNIHEPRAESSSPAARRKPNGSCRKEPPPPLANIPSTHIQHLCPNTGLAYTDGASLVSSNSVVAAGRPTTLGLPTMAGTDAQSAYSPGPVTPVATKFPLLTENPPLVIHPNVNHDPDPCQNPIASGILQSAVSIQNKEQAMSQRKVVGSGRDAERAREAERELNEYQTMAVRASKAMTEEPTGELRYPNPEFAGWGFSKSMPDTALRALFDSLKSACGVNQTGQPDMLTIMEDAEDEPRELPNHNMTARTAKPRMDFSASNTWEALTRPPVDSGGFVFDLTCDDISVLLSVFNLQQYEEKFRQEEIDLEVLLTINESDLKEMGIRSIGARRKLGLAIQKINKAKEVGVTRVRLA